MKHNMKLNPSPFEMIKSGKKTIELRLNDEKRRRIKIGDEIEFENTGDSTQVINAKVLNLYRFCSFDELYKSLPLLKCGYTSDDVRTAHPSDMECYYSDKQQKMYGVVGIEIELIKNITGGQNGI